MKKVITCLNAALKMALIEETNKYDEVDADAKIQIARIVEEVSDCQGDTLIEIEEVSGKEKSKRPKRQPSEYNKFIGSCLKEKIKLLGGAPQAMKFCAAKWKQTNR